MSINLFNDCNNEFLFADGQLLFKKTFINKDSDLLKNILINYSRDSDKLQNTWNSVKSNESVATENERELAVILILNAMVIEAENYIRKEVNHFKKENGVNSDADPKVSAFLKTTTERVAESLKNPRLSDIHTSLFVNSILPIYENVGRSFTKTHEDLNLQSRFLPPTAFNSEHCDEFNARFPIQDSESYRAFRLGNEEEPLFAILTLENGLTPKGVMSINTLVFPTTVAPVLAQNKNQGARNPEMISEIRKSAEHFAYTNRISASTSISQESRKRLFEGAKALYNDVAEKGSVQDLVASAQSELESSVQALSQDRSSPYFGMSPSDIKAGLLSKILGGSEGYNQFAYDVDKAINNTVSTIHASNAIANIAITRFNLSNGGIDRNQANEVIEVQNISIKENTENVLDLLSCIRPILVIDEDALARRGFSVEPTEIPARSNDGGITLGAFAISTGAIALIIVAAFAYIAFADRQEAEKKKEALESLKGTTIWLKDILTNLKTAASAENMIFIRQELATLANTTLTELVEFYRNIEDYKDDVTFVPEVMKFKHLQSNLKSIAAIDPLTLDKVRDALGIQITQATTNEQSLDEGIKLQEERIKEKLKMDFLGSLLKLGTKTANTAGDILKYAGYIALGMFSIWGGVKVYRSLNK